MLTGYIAEPAGNRHLAIVVPPTRFVVAWEVTSGSVKRSEIFSRGLSFSPLKPSSSRRCSSSGLLKRRGFQRSLHSSLVELNSSKPSRVFVDVRYFASDEEVRAKKGKRGSGTPRREAAAIRRVSAKRRTRNGICQNPRLRRSFPRNLTAFLADLELPLLTRRRAATPEDMRRDAYTGMRSE